MPIVSTVGVFSKPHTDAGHALVPRLLGWLAHRSIAVRMDEATAEYAGSDSGLARERVPEGSDLVIVLGGDGTLLSAARAIAGRDIPLFAVNLGSLGFLATITVDALFPELEGALEGTHRIGRRRMLHIDLIRSGSIHQRYEALNDVVVTKSSIARMIEVDVCVNGNFMCSYRADGLIVATPTGSTAYSLSAGGPIVFPSVEAFCITPICPHMLTNRPVLVPSTSTITVENHAEDASAFLTVDGQIGEPLHQGDRVDCRGSDHMIHLVRPPGKGFFDVLRSKLKWGES